MKLPLVRLGSLALDLLFPAQCFGCGKYGSFLCLPCEASSLRLQSPFCDLCAQPLTRGGPCSSCQNSPPATNGIRAPYLMEGAIRQGILDLKYRNLRSAAPTLGRLLGRWLLTNRVPGEALVPVPLHHRRMRERGYNQSALLAKEVGTMMETPVAPGVLVHTRDTLPQVSLPREERIRNVEGCFACPERVEGKSFILVDDVVTTGSTLSACASALKAAGASSVWGIALARQGPGV